MGKGNFLPIVAAAFVILVASGFILFKSSFQKIIAPIPKTTPTSTSDNGTFDSCEVLMNGSEIFPALFKEGVVWNRASKVEYEVSVFPKPIIMKGCLIVSSPVDDNIRVAAFDYYIGYSENYKWETENGGDVPGNGFSVWKIGKKFFLFQWNSSTSMNSKIITLFLSE